MGDARTVLDKLGTAQKVEPSRQSSALDLSFRPSPSNAPLNRLTPEEVRHYNREGYVAPFEVFAPDEVLSVRAYVDRLMKDAGEGGAYGINCYQARLAGLWDIATNQRILDLVEDVVGPNIICWATAVLSKRAGDPKRVPWHQDASFWQLSPARTTTVWLAIDDADETNAAMQFIPRTHDRGAIETQHSEGASVFHKETAGAEALGRPIVNALGAGQVSLHADMLVHGSPPNTSAKRRCGLTLRYCPPEVRILDPAWAHGVEAIICRGSDPSGRWTHHSRPGNDDIRVTTSPHVVGNN